MRRVSDRLLLTTASDRSAKLNWLTMTLQRIPGFDRYIAMDGEDRALALSDYLVLVAALRKFVADHEAEDSASVRDELASFFTVVERDMPRTAKVQSAVHVARSLVVLGRPNRALDCIELCIESVKPRHNS
jgi:hypothetical protein